ncbi:MAG TPA: hypothetical protein PLZ67_09565, partial [Bacteroidales bacterium]|nr:hypothetical protein [Bacteroidales bacterium]
PCAMNRLHENDLDRLFAEKFDDLRVEPPERSWKKVAAGIAITTTVSTAVFSNLIRPVVWSLSTIATIIMITVSNPSSDSEHSNNLPAAQNIPATNISVERLPMLAAISNIPVPSEQKQVDFIPFVIPQNSAESVETVLHENPDLNTVETETERTPELPVLLSMLPTQPISAPHIEWQPQFLSKPNLDFQEKNIIPAWFDLSYQSGPDAFDFGTQNNERITSLAINNGIDISFHFSDFYLRTGVNALNLYQRNRYDYMLNEFAQTGVYTLVDSIWFVQGYDTAGNLVDIPQFSTETYPMYDSVAANYSINANNHYQYIEIPLALGFQKDIHRLSLYAQGGFSYTFLLKTSELNQAEFSEASGIQPLSWQNQSLSRNKDFWSFTLAGGIVYNTNSRFSFGAESTYRYCLSPLYADSELSGKTPVSYGLKLRLIYKLSY